MSRDRLSRPRRLNLQSLEARDVPAAVAATPEFLTDRVLVKMTDDRVPKSPLMKSAESLGNGLYAINLRTNVGVTRGIKHFQLQRGVAYAEPDYVIREDLTPNDPSYGTLWGMHNTGQSGGTADADIDAPEAWDVRTGTSAITVGVIDTGIDYRHVDLYKNVWINQSEIPTAIRSNLTDIDSDGLITFYDLNNATNQGSGKITDRNGNGIIDGGDILTTSASGGWADGLGGGENNFTDDLVGWNFVNNTNNPLDDNNHGSHVSGTIGAMGNNSVGVVGVNWRVQLAGLKFLSASGSGSTSGAINSVNYATARGFKVTNNSWGGGGFSQALSDAITSAQNAGSIFVAAAGNAGANNDTSPHYPSNYPQANVVAVGASTRNDARASFSSYGATTVDLFAPGESILSTTRNNAYATFNGTSMASPHVAGAIALVWDKNPTWTYQQVVDAVKATVDVKTAFQGISVTGGRLNVDKLVRYSYTDTAGPRVNSSAFSGSGNAINNLRATFSEAIKASTFTTADVSFTGPGGSIGVTVNPVSGSTTQFDISFASQSAQGDYTMVIGPNVTDMADNPMNQDGDGTNGEDPADKYTTTRNIPDTTGAKVTASAFSGTANAINSTRFTFNEAIAPSSFTTTDVAFTGPGGAISITSVTAVSGSGNTKFDVAYASQSTPGTYTMTIGPAINDVAGNAMDQDGDGTNGEDPGDKYSTSTTILDITGPKVTGSTFSGTGSAIDNLRVTFSEAIKTSSFGASDVSFIGPNGSIIVTVTPVSGSTTQFDVSFASQSTAGDYTMVIGPNITDIANNSMDQDGDGINGEATEDQYTTTTNIPPPDTAGPMVNSSAFSGSATSINNVRFTFNEAITPSSFTTADVAFTGPGGSIGISSVTPVSGSGNTQFDVAFASQSAYGTYTMTIGPNITDTAGNPMNQDGDGTNGEATDDRYTTSTTLVDTAGPTVTTSSFSGTGNAIDNLRLTFNEAIKASTFTAADVAFSGPGGSIGVTVTPVSGSATQFDVSFASQSTVGDYTMAIGPNITDTADNPMNQDGDSTNGEDPADKYTTTKNIPDTTGPVVTSGAFSGTGNTISSTRFTFNEAINPSTFTTADVAFTGPGGAISASSVTPVAGSGNKWFDVAYGIQSAAGTYTMTIGPAINDVAGNAMNQDGDGTNGEDPADKYTTSTTILDTLGPKVTGSAFTGTGSAIDNLRVAFDEAIAPATFTSADVAFTGPGGSIGVTVTPIAGSTTQFNVSFASQSASGTYTMAIGPNINDVAGNPMNQDGDGTNGENPDDRYTTSTVVSAGQTFNSGNVPLSIQGFTISTLTVGPSLTIHDINVKINLAHTADGELTLVLIGPDFVQTTLVANRGGTGDNFTNTILDDEASQSISTGTAPFTGSYRPEQPLSDFDGTNAQGTWILYISDNNPFVNTGTLISWSITIS